MALGDNFVQALARERRKAALAGRPLSQQEMSGIAEAAQSTADERAARLKALELSEQQHAEDLAFQKQQQIEVERANRARERLAREQVDAATHEKKQKDRMSGATTGAMIGTYIAPGAGTVVGGVIGYFVGDNSYFCTEVYLHCRDNDLMCARDLVRLRKLRNYSQVHYPHWLAFYLSSAPVAIRRIRQKFDMPGEMDDYCLILRKELVNPVLEYLKDGDVAAAFVHYRDTVVPIILEYAPEYEELAGLARVKDDEMRKGVA